MPSFDDFQKLQERATTAEADVTRLKRHLNTEQERLRGHLARARADRDKLVDAISRLISLPSELVAKSYDVTYATDAAPRVIDAAHLARQRTFSERTFGPGRRTEGVLNHITKEMDEVRRAPDDLGEWVDIAILALDGAWRAGYQPQQIIDAIVTKQAKNEARVWPDWRTADPGKAIEHDRSAERED